MPHKFIREIEPGQTINDIFIIKEPILRSTTKGDLYIAMYLCDRSGQLNGRMWQATEAVYQSLPKPSGFVYIQGRSEIYQNNLQIVANNVTAVEAGKVNLDDYLPRTDKDVEQLLGEIKEILAKIKSVQIKALVNEFLADKSLMEKFKKSPAAIKVHHSFIGGLIEHTHTMLRAAVAILPLYPRIQGDVVLAGIFLHDIGKTEELTYDTVFSYTDSGQLLGHIAQGLLMLKQKADSLAAKGKAVDQTILDAIGHIILSHHGQYEFGSPKLPATAEAYMVNYIDDLDAKIGQVTGAIDNETSESNWTSWQKSLETRIYKKRIEEAG
jgi:3'-5' exoribonuclease